MNLLLSCLKKDNFISYSITFITLCIKTLGAFLFSYVLINKFGDVYHVKVMHDISILFGAAIIARFGLDQCILKYATLLIANGGKKQTFLFLLQGTFILIMTSMIAFLYFSEFNFFELLTPQNASYLIFMVNFSLCLGSFLRCFDKVHFSGVGDSGFVMFTVTILLIFDLLDGVLLLEYVWSIISIAMFSYVIYIICFTLNENGCYRIPTSQFLKLLPYLLINSLLNFFQQWGSIFISTVYFSPIYSSSFVMLVRICSIFNAILIPISSYTVPRVIKDYYHDINLANLYMKRSGKVYLLAALVCTVASLGIIYILSLQGKINIQLLTVSSVLFYVVTQAYHLATGPVNQVLSLLDQQKPLILFRCLILILFLLLLYFSLYEYTYIYVLSLYILIQKVFLVFLLKNRCKLIV